MERLAGILDPGSTIRPGDLKPQIVSGLRARAIEAGPNEIVIRTDQTLESANEQLEREMIGRALKAFPDNQSGAVRVARHHRKGLFDKRRRLGLP